MEGTAPARAGRSQPDAGPIVKGPWIRVLHVNDNTDDQILFQAACRKAKVPLNWHVADSAAKGISYLRTLVEQAAKNMPVCWPAVILLDVVMPEGSGLAVLKYIRATPELKDMPVVVFSAYDRAQEESLRLGANAFWVKPLDFMEIVDVAKRLYDLIREYRGLQGA